MHIRAKERLQKIMFIALPNSGMTRPEIKKVVILLVHLAQDIDQWRAVVNTVMNLRGS